MRQAHEDSNESEEWAYKVGGNGKPLKREWGKDRHETGSARAENNADKVIQELKQRIEKLENQRDKAPRKSRDKKEVQCFNCQQKGHYARECPEKGCIRHEMTRCNEEKKSTEQPLNMKGPALAAKGRSN